MILGALVIPQIAVVDFSTKDGVEYATHAVIEGKPRDQFVGEAQKPMTLSLYLHREFIDPVATYEALKAMMLGREVFVVQHDNGAIVGTFKINSLTPSNRKQYADGWLLAQHVDLDMSDPGVDGVVPTVSPLMAIDGSSGAVAATGTPADEDTSTPKDDVDPATIVRR